MKERPRRGDRLVKICLNKNENDSEGRVVKVTLFLPTYDSFRVQSQFSTFPMSASLSRN
jgi:hypothetical protein